jgi:bifunctional DNA-binding transcriptional regulator/antitoxin component of YhaV-PrlF toxin-antitoxin module
MATRVGTKGQVVIEKPIRDALGVEPGWITVQRIVGKDRVEVRFYPAEHERSLRGVLAEHVGRSLASDRFEDVRREAWASAAKRRIAEDR